MPGLAKMIAALDGGAPGIDDRKHIGLGIGHAALGIQRVRPPGFRDRRRRCVSHLRTGPVGDAGEIVHRFLHRLAARSGIHLQPSGDVEEQAACPTPSGAQLGIRFGVMRPGNRVDLRHGSDKIGTREPLEQRGTPLIQRQIILRDDQLGHVAQQDRGIIEVAQASQPDFLLGALGILDQVSEQRFGQFGRVILGGCLQRVEQRRHSRCPARFLQGRQSQRVCPRGRPAPAAPGSLPARLWAATGAGRRHGWRRACRGAEEVRRKSAASARSAARPGRRGWTLASLVEQGRNPRALLFVERCHQTVPQALLCPVPDAADKAFKDADAWQQHLVHDQPGRGALDQRAGMVVTAPAQCIQPSGQAEPGWSVVGKLGEAVALADQGQVAKALPAVVEIALEPGLWRQPQLTDQESRDRLRDIAVGAGKGAQEPGRSEHEAKAQAVVVTTQLIDDFPIAAVQVEIPRQFVRRWCGGEPGVVLPLLVGQVASGHGVRNLGLLRGVKGARKMLNIFLAKYLCGSLCFSNMFCEAARAPA